MKTNLTYLEPEFKPITITIVLETLKELDEFYNVVELPFLELGYDCLYDLLRDLERI